MAQLFGRTCTVLVDALRIEGLRVQFTIRKSLAKEPNTAEVKITNLAATSRAEIKRKGARVIVTAGYPENAAVIFTGDSRLGEHLRENTDWITRIQCGDGEQAYQFARLSESFAPGTPIVDVVRTIVGALGLNVGNVEEQLAAGDFRGGLAEFAHGYAAHGKAATELDRVLRSVGLTWSIQHGAIQVLRGGAPAKGTAVLLTPDTGLVGSPTFGTPDAKGASPILRARSLLQPQIRCGGAVEIRTEGVNGQFRVERLTHAGDTHGGDWYTDLEARPIA